MADYQLSGAAEQDLAEIYTFSYRSFGEAKADAYLLSLEEYFVMLADNPRLGRRVDHIREGYFRFEHQSHSIFYTQRESGILIVRILHSRMDAERQLKP